MSTIARSNDTQLIDALFASLPGLVYVIDESGGFVRWNRGYESILGYSDEELRAMNALAIVVDEDRASVEGFLSRTSTFDSSSISVRLLARDGRTVPMLFSGARVTVGDNRYIIGTGVDARTQLVTEKALRDTEERYRAIFNATSDVLFIHAQDGALIDVNDRVTAVYGCSREEMLGQSPERFSAESKAYTESEVRNRIERAVRGEAQTFEGRARRFDGTPFWTEVALRAAEIGGELRVIASVRDSSARKEAEAALGASEEQVRQLFDGAADVFLIHDSEGRIINANAAATRVLGYSLEEFRRMTVSDFDVAVSADALSRIWSEVSAGRDVTVESVHRRKDGTTLPVDVHVTTFKQGKASLMFAVARDISARKRAEAESRSAERRLTLAVSATADAIWEHNIDTDTSYYSPRWYEMLGFEGQGFPMTRAVWESLCHPDDYRRVFEGASSPFSAADSNYHEIEFRVKRSEGSWIWLMLRGSVVERDVGGRPRVIAGTITDVTRRKASEQESAAWKQRYELLTLAARQIVYDYRTTGEITWGGVFEELLGYGPDEMMGGIEQWRERVHPDERQQAWDKVVDAEAKGTGFLLEYRFRCKSGEYLLVEDAGFPYFDAKGKVERYIGVISNITEQRNVELERERLEESLRQAQKMESIGRLAGGVAHDFNNLLTAIGGNLQLALMEERPAEAGREMLTDALKAVDSAANLTRQLLTFSRKQVIHPKVVNLNDIVLRMQKMLGRLLGEDVELRVSVVDKLGQVRIDEGQAEQILVNLAVNGRDAMPEGGKLTLETENVTLDDAFCVRHGGAKPGEYVMLAVSDTGCGMSPEVQARLFEPFFTTKAVGKGTGLGLSMVYGAVHQNGGTIAVSSRVGVGSTFRIYLPRLNAAVAKTEPPPVEVPRTGDETIVLVEDEDQVRNLAERILRRLGYEVLAFESGRDALEAIAKLKTRVDLLLTDVIMPDMNGRTLADQVRGLRPEIKVLFASGYTEDAIVHHGVLEEGIDFIAKPYTVNELAKRIRAVLERPAGENGTTPGGAV